jgi:hypothetical protein
MERAGEILTSMKAKAAEAKQMGLLSDTTQSLVLQLTSPTALIAAPRKRVPRRQLNFTDPVRVLSIDQDQEIDLGFMAKQFVIVGLPHSDPGKETVFRRTNGNYQVKLTSDSDYGLPYGMYPRILATWLTTEAVQKKSRYISLGSNLSTFLRDKLSLGVRGGARGTIEPFKDQLRRFLTCTISITEDSVAGGRKKTEFYRMIPARHMKMWWDPDTPDQDTLFNSHIELTQDFYESLTRCPVPVDWNVIRELRKSPLALDLYFWLTHKMSSLRRRTTVAWTGPTGLSEQIGSNYNLANRHGTRNFQMNVTDQLVKIHRLYPAAKFDVTDVGITVFPSPTHVPKSFVFLTGTK